MNEKLNTCEGPFRWTHDELVVQRELQSDFVRPLLPEEVVAVAGGPLIGNRNQ